MRKVLGIVIFLITLTACNDGDLIDLSFDFEDEFTINECGQLIFYKINDAQNESLALSLSGISLESLFAFDEVLNQVQDTIIIERNINGTTNRLNYRVYNGTVTGNDLFCNPIPPANVSVRSEEDTPTGTVIITIIARDDDNDGIPAEFEDVNGNGNLFDDDSDNDGIPNFLDVDDDGDNVLTRDELTPNTLNTDPRINPLDTDGDGIPDYLDIDDDGDGALTRDEENILQDENPRNDITEPGGLPDYLNPNVSTSVPAVAFRPHAVVRTYTIKVQVNNVQFSFLNQTILDFGENVSTVTVQKFPVFN
ncbi:hypothetical protein FJ651_13075 [Paucihalobacter ruber]|uniref:Uncharacterized protein n=1 Tax=Paucihalobacter ruber TaxID=2567861 RepID=A0A506PHC3_9FLAO|nr:hypothetical protein [Paucihalobacter ruber]TPV32487.1 hypothetical protein FJ651_13075 [Paucihalobacter ruber]